MSSSKVCKKCNSNEVEVDRARGITYCTICGDVLEESIIVSEIQIEEGSGGGVNIIGQFVGANDTRGISINGLQHSLRESKEITLQNGKRLINEMASQLRLNQHCMDTAFNFYKIAVQRGLTRGRKIRQVIAACLYLVCRTEGTPHMLLDLCDIVHDDACYISSLGKLAMKFAYLLCIKLPEIDPGLFIPRFAQKLDFGDKTHDVELTAMRLVQRMNRDWMATGRRPSGLCGAALLVAARMYDFQRSLDDIVKVVKIGKTTLRKRMLEFEDTPSSNLTIDEFHTIDLEEEHDPPAYTRSRKFAKIKQIEEMVNIQEIEREIIQLQENIEAALSELHKPRGIMAKYAKICEFENEILGPNKDQLNIDNEIKEAEEFLSEEQISIIRSIVGPIGSSDSASNAPTPSSVQPCTSGEGAEKLERGEDESKWNNLRPTLRSLGLARSSNYKHHMDDYDEEDEDGDEENDSDDDDLLDDEEDGYLDEEEGGDEDPDLRRLRRKRKRALRLSKRTESTDSKRLAKEPTPATEGLTESRRSSTNQSAILASTSTASIESAVVLVEVKKDDLAKPVVSVTATATVDDPLAEEGELDLTGIDDDEIDSMLLSKDEIKTKAKLWLRANKDWLKEQKAREDQKKKERDESKVVETKQKKPRIRKPKNMTPVANPQEAIERMLQEKKISSKINYDVLKNLNKDLKKPFSSDPS